jgi:hypothetical protein
MATPQSDGESLNVVHEHKAVKGGEFTAVLLRVRYERRNMEAFLSSVGISQANHLLDFDGSGKEGEPVGFFGYQGCSTSAAV